MEFVLFCNESNKFMGRQLLVFFLIFFIILFFLRIEYERNSKVKNKNGLLIVSNGVFLINN